jgi:hypothetical protein
MAEQLAAGSENSVAQRGIKRKKGTHKKAPTTNAQIFF